MAVDEPYPGDSAVSSSTSAGIASAEDYAECHRIMKASSRNYSFASRFLPHRKRHHVEALYALLRVGDDRVDVSCEGFSSEAEAIANWEQLYWEAFEQGDSEHPVMRAYLNTALECGIPAGVVTPYFRAMKEDLTITRFPDYAALMHYMNGSAVPVGRAMTHILGTRAPYAIADALPGADSLSVGMQLSNFWRDIGDDWTCRGRIYIPQEDMDRFGYTEEDLAASRINPSLVELLEFEFERTERCYAEARASVRMLAVGRWGVMSGLGIYRNILDDIRRHHYDVFTRRAHSTPSQMIMLVARSWWQTRRGW